MHNTQWFDDIHRYFNSVYTNDYHLTSHSAKSAIFTGYNYVFNLCIMHFRRMQCVGGWTQILCIIDWWSTLLCREFGMLDAAQNQI